MTTSAIRETRHLSQSSCPQPEKTGWIERFFDLSAKGTSIKQESMAGVTTFLTMAYIIFVNPQILSAAGMDAQAVFVTTCLIAAIGSIAMGVFANLPIAMAPAMGLNSYFAFFLVGSMGLAWQTGMAVIFLGFVAVCYSCSIPRLHYHQHPDQSARRHCNRLRPVYCPDWPA
ncbi:xanthine/uracil/vitamin C permease (AzgA family) [Endozoicomonas sp. NE35]